uniref:Uncharacterized protein n=1 Tax=Knipowitschia caucasica TaxID=637954 RepID=A0AAV2LNS5_KNICA
MLATSSSVDSSLRLNSIDWEDKTLLPELEEWPLSSPEEDFTPHICHLCCCPEPMKISARGRLQFLQPGPLKRGCVCV